LKAWYDKTWSWGKSHQPVYLDPMTNSGQHNSSQEVHDLHSLLVNQVCHLLLLSQNPPSCVDAHADEIGAHVLGSAAAQKVILTILNEAQLSSIVHQANLHAHVSKMLITASVFKHSVV